MPENGAETDERTVYLPVAAAARRVGLSRRQVMILVRQGRAPGYRVGRRTLVREHEVRAALEGCRVAGADS